MVPRHISLIDLMSFEESREIVTEGDTDSFLSLMYSIGFDTEFGISSRECYHIPLTLLEKENKMVWSVRFEGRERSDPQWIGSGYASEYLEDHLLIKKDRHLFIELCRMSQYPNWSGMLMDYKDHYLLWEEEEGVEPLH